MKKVKHIKERYDKMNNIFFVLKKIFQKFFYKNRIQYLPNSVIYVKEHDREEYKNSLKVNIQKRIEYYNGYGIQDERKISLW